MAQIKGGEAGDLEPSWLASATVPMLSPLRQQVGEG